MTRGSRLVLACAVVAVGSLVVVEVGLIISRGHGFFLTRRLPQHAWAVRDLRAVAEYCDEYAKAHGNARPAANLVAQNVPYVRLAENQPYVENRLWVLESTESSETYLYSPYDRREWTSHRAQRVYACNVATLAAPGGRYYVYLRNPQEDYHVVAKDYVAYAFFVQTRGIPVVPGCTFEGPAGAMEIAPMSPAVAEALRAYYPDVQLPPKALLSGQSP
jgi:hypothetical protein